jgi:prepilin-type N-terminal cleavage/methylation domain-containing protein
MLNNIKTKLKNRKKGFSLIEMVVVIAIMAILALIMVPNLTAYIQKGDDAQIKANMKNVHTAAELVVQSDPGIYVKDMPFASRTGKYASATAIRDEIAKFANVTPANVTLRAAIAAGTPTAVAEGTFHLSPITATGRILVVTSSDRMTYTFDGLEYKEYVR